MSTRAPQPGPTKLDGAKGVIVLTPSVTAESVSRSRDLLAIGRFGVGYDAVDVGACTLADVVVFITAEAPGRPVRGRGHRRRDDRASTHHLRTKDILVRAGHWDERSRYMEPRARRPHLRAPSDWEGSAGRRSGSLRGFGMKPPLVFDPYLERARTAEAAGVRLVALGELLSQADFVSIHCPRTDQTRGLIGARELGLMKPDAYLINTARGGIVDEGALHDALAERRIAGAALDCFADEPITRPHRFGELDNVLLAPHCIAWTDELFRDIGRSACQGMLDLSLGKVPRGVVNPQVFDRPGFQEKMGPVQELTRWAEAGRTDFLDQWSRLGHWVIRRWPMPWPRR